MYITSEKWYNFPSVDPILPVFLCVVLSFLGNDPTTNDDVWRPEEPPFDSMTHMARAPAWQIFLGHRIPGVKWDNYNQTHRFDGNLLAKKVDFPWLI